MKWIKLINNKYKNIIKLITFKLKKNNFSQKDNAILAIKGISDISIIIHQLAFNVSFLEIGFKFFSHFI